MSSKLTIDDLHLILTKLLPAKNEWQEIGTALGLKDFDIQGITSTKPQQALSTVLSTVLKIKSLTWENLIDVLREPIVSQDALANELAERYAPSKRRLEEESVAKKLPVLKRKRSKGKGQEEPGLSKKQKLETLDPSSEDYSTDDVPTNEDTGDSDEEQSSNEDQPDTGDSDEEQSSNEDQPDTDDLDSPQLYEMKNRQALIINIVKHPVKKKIRRGSDKDKDELIKTFKKLGYTVHVETDLKRRQIIPRVRAHAKDEHCDSFICCILAHGNQGVVCGSDGKTVEIKEISKALNEVTQLRGNPKIFFFQACQGSATPKALAEVDDGSSTSSAKPIEIDAAIPKLPRDSDFFYGCASSFETASMRDPNEGSLYIQALCRVLKRKYKEEDLLTMVTRAHCLVAEDERQLKKGKKYVYYQQQPQLVSTLRKQVHF